MSNENVVYKVHSEDIDAFASVVKSVTGKTDPLAWPEDFAVPLKSITETYETLKGYVGGSLKSYTNSYIDCVRSYAFYSFSYPLSYVNFPEAVSVGDYAFAYCRYINYVGLPKAQIIGLGAFSGCSSLASISLPNVTYVSSYAFCSCSKLTSVYTPNLLSAGSNAFYGCYSLRSIDVSNLVTINESTFAGCRSISSIYLPKVETIGRWAFQSCYKLLDIYLSGSSVVSLAAANAFLSTPISTYTTSTGGVYGNIHVPSSLYNDYLSADVWSVYSSRITSM